MKEKKHSQNAGMLGIGWMGLSLSLSYMTGYLVNIKPSSLNTYSIAMPNTVIDNRCLQAYEH